MLRWLFHFLLALSLAGWFLAGALWVRSYSFNEVISWWLPPTREAQFGITVVTYTGEACFVAKLFRFQPSQRTEYVESMFGSPVPGEPRLLEGDHGVLVHSKRWADEPPGEYEESSRNFGLPRFHVESVRRPGAWGPVSEVQLRVPCWFLMLAASILPAASLTGGARRRLTVARWPPEIANSLKNPDFIRTYG